MPKEILEDGFESLYLLKAKKEKDFSNRITNYRNYIFAYIMNLCSV